MPRGIFFEEEHAREAERVLREGGHEVVVRRERYAGEDDDEDHPWAVETDAPVVALEILLDRYDGWLDDDVPLDGPGGMPAGTVELPTSPRRHHRPE